MKNKIKKFNAFDVFNAFASYDAAADAHSISLFTLKYETSADIYDIEGSESDGLFIGGTFQNIYEKSKYPFNKYLTKIDKTTNSIITSSYYPGDTANRYIEGIIKDDEENKYWIYGYFTSYRSGSQMVPITSLARLNSDLTLDDSWNVNINTTVRDVCISGSYIFLCGDFNTVSGSTRNRLAKLDKTTGALQPWNPNAGGNVLRIKCKDNSIYATGFFSTISGTSQAYTARMDSTTGQLYKFPATDSYAYDIVFSGSNAYVGGYFNYIDTNNRGLCVFQTGTSDVLASIFSDTGLSTVINTIIPDGNNGWYIGGTFSSILGETRNNVARINSDLTLNPWNPNANAGVSALLLSGNSVFIGGNFAQISSTIRSCVAKVHATTGALDPWNPVASSQVYSINFSGSHIFLGGQFTTVSGSTRNRLAKVHTTTGALDPWNPNVSSASSYVYDITFSGSNLFAAGTFTTVSGSTRNRLVKVHTTTGALSPWNPNANSTVYSLMMSGVYVFAGGNFTTVSGSSRLGIAKLHTTTGALDSWGISVSPVVRKIKLFSNKLHFVSNSAFTVSGVSYSRYGILSTTSSSFEPNGYPYFDNSVYDFEIGNKSIFGGAFTKASSISKSGLFCVNNSNLTSSYTVLNFASPNTGNESSYFISSLDISGSTMYVGGNFSKSYGTDSGKIYRYNTYTNTKDESWNPRLGVTGSSGLSHNVQRICPVDGFVYVAGSFVGNSVSSTASYFAKINETTGDAVDLYDKIKIEDNMSINRLYDMQNNEILILGNNVVSYHEPCRYILRLDESGSKVNAFSSINGDINVIKKNENENAYYIGGSFTSFSGIARKGIVKINSNNEVDESFVYTSAYGVGNVKDIQFYDNKVFAAGQFEVYDEVLATGLVSMTGSGSFNEPWKIPDADGTLYSLSISGNTCYTTGIFSKLYYRYGQYLTAINKDTLKLVNHGLKISNPVSCICSDGSGGFFIGGLFTEISGVQRNYIARLNSDLTLNEWHSGISFNAQVKSLCVSGSSLFVGGSFTDVDGSGRNYFVKMDKETRVLDLSFADQALDNSVDGILTHGDQLFLTGDFLLTQGQNRPGFVKISSIDGTTTEWNIAPVDAKIYAMGIYENDLYLGGDFTLISGVVRPKLARLNIATSYVDSWEPSPDLGVRSLDISGSKLAIGGLFENVSGTYCPNIAAIDLSTNLLMTSSYSPGLVGCVKYYEDKLYGSKSTDFSHFILYADTMEFSGNLNIHNTGPYYQINTSGSNILMIGEQYRSGYYSVGVSSFDLDTGDISNNSIFIEPGTVYCAAEHLDNMYLGGNFSFVNGANCFGFVKIKKSDFSLVSTDIQTNNVVNTLLKDGNYLYVGGSYSQISGVTRSNLCRLNLTNDEIDSWDPMLEMYVNTIKKIGNSLYVGGYYYGTTGSTLERNIVKIDL